MQSRTVQITELNKAELKFMTEKTTIIASAIEGLKKLKLK